MAYNPAWYVVVDRHIVDAAFLHESGKIRYKAIQPYVVGPYPNEEAAQLAGNAEDGIIYNLLTSDAKRDGYFADECYWTTEIPETGIIRIESDDLWRMSYDREPEWWSDETQPRCDDCGIHMEEADEWCGECGSCKQHCSGCADRFDENGNQVTPEWQNS